MEQLGSRWTDFHEIWYSNIFRKTLEKVQLSLKSDKNNGYFLCEAQYTFLIISRSFLLGMRNVSDKRCRENQNTQFVFSNFFFENRAVYEIILKNVERGRPQITIWRVHIIYWKTKVLHIHTQTHTLTHTLTHTHSQTHSHTLIH